MRRGIYDVGTARGPRAPARATDPPAEEAAPTAAADPRAALPAAAAAPRRTARATVAATFEGLLGATETAAGAAAARTLGGAAQKGETRGERYRVHGGETEAAGVSETAGVRLLEDHATG